MRFFTFITLVAFSLNTLECKPESESLGRIVRGHDAEIAQFPYAVRLSVKIEGGRRYTCVAALIGKCWLLTAAHCVDRAKKVKVYLGSIYRNAAGKHYSVLSSNVVLYPGFHKSSYCNDIALVNIPRTRFSRKIAVVLLPKMTDSRPTYENASALACGWGKTTPQGDLAMRLQYGRLRILNRNDCRTENFIEIPNNVICTAVSPKSANVCAGDSGGPLVLETTGELVGIASFGDKENCDDGNTPIFTRVDSYLVWIKSVSGISY